ncbi:MFS transporter [Streptosporangium fragile]|uniref:MFS transporter n=1 Tax=Streptosporangium fragile TaxID=46186 RepID=UPI0031E90863
MRKQRDYRLLFSARVVSDTGTEVSRLAVPMTAAALLGASAAQMGLLTAAASLPYLLIGLQAGAVADRLRRRRPVMIACEVAAATAVGTIPLAWIAGLLTVPWLIAVEFVVSACAMLFRTLSFPHITAVVHESQRTEALAGLQSAYALSSVGGPGLAGLLVQTVTAPLAMAVDALSFLVSAFLLRAIDAPEDHTPAPARGMWAEVREGLSTVLGHPTLRAVSGAAITVNFFAAVYMALFILYALGTLGLPGGLVGALTALFGAGGLIGAVLTPRLVRRFGEDRILVHAALAFPLNYLAVALAAGPLWAEFLLLAGSTLVTGVAIVTFATCFGAIVLREAPENLRGRVSATTSFAMQGVMTLGGLAGGLLGELLGLRPVFWICAAGMIVIPPLLLSPLRRTAGPAAP